MEAYLLQHEPWIRLGAFGLIFFTMAAPSAHIVPCSPALWRLHRMHHADLDFDVTTGGRFHPVEIVISGGVKLAAIAIFWPSPLAVFLFEVLLNASSMFNHSNVRIPVAIDAVLRLFVVTPDMHRVHHSVLPHETNTNFGFNLPWWDRLFGTYRAQPSVDHEHLKIGIRNFREPRELRLDRMLFQPLRGNDGGYPFGSRDKVSQCFREHCSIRGSDMPVAKRSSAAKTCQNSS
jgi:sterol desaturase/sphingolipid hydroxylase (fatty acid hydroxylase superfamily)